MTENERPESSAVIELPLEARATDGRAASDAARSLRTEIDAFLRKAGNVRTAALGDTDIEVWVNGGLSEATPYVRDLVIGLSETFGLEFRSDGPSGEWGDNG